jgi:ribosomal protein S27AE
MRNSLTLAATLIGLLGIGIAIAALLLDRGGTFCPLCGSKLATKKGSVVCTSCGVTLRFEEP